MPHLTPEQRDDLDEAIDRQTFRIWKKFSAFFGEDMTDDELRRTKGNIQRGVSQAMRQSDGDGRGGGTGLPPAGGSRIYGQPNLGLGNSAISNLPGEPGDQTIQHPMLRGRVPIRPQDLRRTL